ncbi:MAG: hypothetical protein JO256_04740 [Alphaproteobacteria bacterium]|nr:hypothetical protein [Alphaproteobacteria bacterium]
MVGKLPRTVWRITLVLLACAPVIATSWMLTPPFNQAANERDLEQHLTKRPPTPGSEATLRQAIGDMQHSKLDYARLNKGLVNFPHNRLLRFQQVLIPLGPLQSLHYVGGTPRPDFYRVTFRNGSQLWGIYMGKNGRIEGLNVEKTPEPGDYIDGYASFPAGVRLQRAAVQLAVLLGAALFGRSALRLRL